MFNYQRLTASGQVTKGGSLMAGFIAASASSGTLALYDGTNSSGTLILNTMSLTPGQFVPLPVLATNGIYAVIGGTADITFCV
jgi:hypothetical protein